LDAGVAASAEEQGDIPVSKGHFPKITADIGAPIE
jgi:hypothetical protein